MCLDPFYVHDKGWIAAQRLVIGDQIELQSGEDAYVDAVEHEKLSGPIQVYNFEVEEFHTYFVGNACVLVHNMCQTLKGSQNPTVADAARRGQEIHKAWNYGPGVNKEVTIRGILNGNAVTRRIDGLDSARRIIYEWKPNNPRAIARGTRQVANYAKILGGKWTTKIITY